MILQLNGQLTPAYKHFQRVALHNPGMTLVEYLAIQRGYRIYVGVMSKENKKCLSLV